jgi:hypothetical protein
VDSIESGLAFDRETQLVLAEMMAAKRRQCSRPTAQEHLFEFPGLVAKPKA